MNADGLSRTELGARVRITRQYGYGPHSVLGELTGVRHGRESSTLDVNVLGENLSVQVGPDDEVEVLGPGV